MFKDEEFIMRDHLQPTKMSKGWKRSRWYFCDLVLLQTSVVHGRPWNKNNDTCQTKPMFNTYWNSFNFFSFVDLFG